MNQNLSGRNLNETREAAISVTEGKDASFLGLKSWRRSRGTEISKAHFRWQVEGKRSEEILGFPGQDRLKVFKGQFILLGKPRTPAMKGVIYQWRSMSRGLSA